MIRILKCVVTSKCRLPYWAITSIFVILPLVSNAQSIPLPKGVGLSVKATSYGGELYVPISVGEQWEIGLQYVMFWREGYYQNFHELQNTGLKSRYFFSPTRTGHYAGVFISANGFEDESSGNAIRYTPVLGASYGYEFPVVRNWIHVGLEVEGGLGTAWRGYFGGGISLNFYYR